MCTHTHTSINKDTCAHTLLLVQQEVAVLIAASDGIGDTISVWVVGEDDSDQRVGTSVLAQEGPVAANKGRYSTTVGEVRGRGQPMTVC